MIQITKLYKKLCYLGKARENVSPTLHQTEKRDNLPNLISTEHLSLSLMKLQHYEETKSSVISFS